jgi:serine/threonine protein kinase
MEELGRGGMGIVYRAHQITLDRPAALKILSDQYAGNTEYVVDFIKEARAAAKLNHPHIVQAYAVGEDEGVYFFAMEFINGETMKTYMKREGSVPIDFAMEVIQQIAEALDYAWKEQRLIHRDIKPDNIMLAKNGRAKLADLGLARVAGEIEDADSDEVLGTPQYISPEHLTGADMDIRSDIYSLGATLFHLATGRFVFEGKTATDIARKHLEAPVPSPRKINPKLSEGVCDIILKMMAKNPNDRYQTAGELVEDLRLVRKGKKIANQKKQFSKKKGSKTTVTMKAPTVTTIRAGATTTNLAVNTESLRIQREKKAKNQIVFMIITVVVVLIACVVLIIIKNQPKKKKKKPVPVLAGPIINKDGKPSPGLSKKTKEPLKSKYTVAIAEILNFEAKNPERKSDILLKCDQFFKEYPEPSYGCDRAALPDLLNLYIPLDEERRIIPARKRLKRKHMSIVNAVRLKAEGRIENMERKKREEERRQQEQEQLAERKRNEQERLEFYIKEVELSKPKLIYRAYYYFLRNDYEKAIKVFDAAIDEPNIIKTDYKKPKAFEFSEWAQKFQDAFKIAAQTWETLLNSKSKLKGIQLEVKKGIIAVVVEVKNGNLISKTFTNELISIKPKDLTDKQLKKLLTKISDLIQNPNASFYYMMCSGRFKMAKEICPPDWNENLEEGIVAYLVNKMLTLNNITDEQERKETIRTLKRYRSLPEFAKAKDLYSDEQARN